MFVVCFSLSFVSCKFCRVAFSVFVVFFILDGVDVLALFLWWTFIKEEMLQELQIRRSLQQN